MNVTRKDDVSVDLVVDEFAGDKLLFIDFTKTVADQKERIQKLEDLVRTLVKFAVHDGLCARVKYEGEQPPDCTCGLQKVYKRIDELIE
jgi:hypothetical protein